MKILRLMSKAQTAKRDMVFLGAPSFRKKFDVKAYVDEGYSLNPIVYRCVKEITTAIGSVDIVPKSGDKEITDESITRLLTRPNISQSWVEFIREAVSEYLLTGNCFILKNPETGKPIELWVVPSKYMTVVLSQNGFPKEYKFDNGSQRRIYTIDQLTGLSPIIHWKDYNPNDKFSGMPTMSAVALSADVHNNGLRWNSSLLENGGKVSGILEIEGSPSNDAIERLRKYFKEAYLGKDNAGNVPLVTDGTKFTQIDRSPVDMDFLNTMKETAKYIASAFGVPLPLIDNDSASFNNVQQSKERLWTDTVLPLLDSLLNSLSIAFTAAYGKEIRLSYDPDSIPSIEGLRKQKVERLYGLVEKGIITINEARKELGFEPIDGGDTLFLPSSNIPIGMAADTGGTDSSVKKALGRMGLSEAEIFEATGIGQK